MSNRYGISLTCISLARAFRISLIESLSLAAAVMAQIKGDHHRSIFDRLDLWCAEISAEIPAEIPAEISAEIPAAMCCTRESTWQNRTRPRGRHAKTDLVTSHGAVNVVKHILEENPFGDHR